MMTRELTVRIREVSGPSDESSGEWSNMAKKSMVVKLSRTL